MKYLQKYGREENLMTYYFNNAILSMNKIQIRNGQKAASYPSLRKATPESWRTTDITLTAKVYHVMLLNYIQPEVKKILYKNQNDFQINWSITSDSDNPLKSMQKILRQHLFIVFSKEFNSIHRRKTEQILLA